MVDLGCKGLCSVYSCYLHLFIQHWNRLGLRDEPLYMLHVIFNPKLRSSDLYILFSIICVGMKFCKVKPDFHKFVRIRRIPKTSSVITRWNKRWRGTINERQLSTEDACMIDYAKLTRIKRKTISEFRVFGPNCKICLNCSQIFTIKERVCKLHATTECPAFQTLPI